MVNSMYSGNDMQAQSTNSNSFFLLHVYNQYAILGTGTTNLVLVYTHICVNWFIVYGTLYVMHAQRVMVVDNPGAL